MHDSYMPTKKCLFVGQRGKVLISFLFSQRTQRVPKDARHPLASNPPEFARVLTEKLEQVKLEQEIQEREAKNLTAHGSEVGHLVRGPVRVQQCMWPSNNDIRGLGKQANIKVENSGAAVYVGSLCCNFS